jgi:tetratricopeptide (TPR) repeat protein
VPLLSELGDLYFKSDRIAEALQVTEATVAMYDRTGRSATMGRVIAAMNHAAILSRAGEVAAATAAQEGAIRNARGVDTARGLPAGFAGHLGNSLLRLARYDEAMQVFAEGLEQARAAGNARFVASTELMLGRTLGKLKRFDEAEEHLARAEAGLNVNRGGNVRLLNELALTRADIHVEAGRPQEAARIVGAVLADLGYPPLSKAAGIGSALHVAARVALANDDAQMAERYATDSLEVVTALARDARRSADVGQARLLRAEARRRQGQAAAAREDATFAVAALEAGFGANHPETKRARALLAALSPPEAAAPAIR